MSVIGSEILAGASGNQGYFIQRSLRFRSSASANLTRTPSTTSNRKTWTWSAWIKRGALSQTGTIWGSNFSSGGFGLAFGNYGGVGVNPEYIGVTLYAVGTVTTAAVFRDPSAWYHIVAKFDSTQATQANRFALYVNGVQQTLSGTLNVTLNADYNVNLSGALHVLGGESGYYNDLYMAEVNFIDGQALTPSSFGQTDAVTGVWTPKKYTGTYGTNGFYLPFSDNTSATTLAYDKSGNGNNWTPNNISTTAGATYDSMTDVPTQSIGQGNGSSNYAVLNPLDKGTGATTSNGNLRVDTTSGSPNSQIRASMPITSKAYCEFTVTAASGAGTAFGPAVVNMDVTMDLSNTLSGSYQILWTSNGYIYNPASNSGYTTFAAGDVLGVAYDPTTKYVWFAKNNVWITGNPSTGSGGFTSTDLTSFGSTQTFSWYDGTSSNAQTVDANFGQRPFSYTPPTGFVALNTYNLPTPTILVGNKYMDATLYTGNGSTQTITNAAGFQPDFVWNKDRSNASSHALFDSVRGVTKELYSNTTDAEGTTSGVTSFNSNGYTVGSNTRSNANGSSFVGWQWKAGGTAVTNTAGSITSQVSANPSAGFSIVKHTNTGAPATIGHGLGIAPKLIINKVYSRTENWRVYFGVANKLLILNSTAVEATDANIWNNTQPTSSVFSIGTYFSNGDNIISYCFAPISGYSAFGSYTGNGSTDGSFVYTGFRPKYVLLKSSTQASPWQVFDTSRDTYNVGSDDLLPNSSAAEVVFATVDILSNGFKLRYAGDPNTSGQSYIYAAFAENPFKYSNAR